MPKNPAEALRLFDGVRALEIERDPRAVARYLREMVLDRHLAMPTPGAEVHFCIGEHDRSRFQMSKSRAFFCPPIHRTGWCCTFTVRLSIRDC